MIELSLKLSTSVYDQLRAAAIEENVSIHDFLLGLIAEKFPPSGLETVHIERSYYEQFATDWALPERQEYHQRD